MIKLITIIVSIVAWVAFTAFFSVFFFKEPEESGRYYGCPFEGNSDDEPAEKDVRIIGINYEEDE